MSKARGALEPFQSDNYKGRDGFDNDVFGILETDENMATTVGYFGASPHQLNYEYSISSDSAVGSLSYAFSKALIEAKPEDTYEMVFDNIMIIMTAIAPHQNPTSEGILQQEILGGKIRDRSLHFKIKEYQQSMESAYVILNSGALHGIFEGSVVGLYDKNIEDPVNAEAKVSGKVVKSNPLTTVVKLDHQIGKSEALNSWVYIEEQSFGNLGVRVKLDLENNALEDKLRSAILSSKESHVVQSNPDLLIESNNGFTRGDRLQIIQANDNDELPIWSKSSVEVEGNLDQAAYDIISIVKDYGRTKYIRTLNVQDPNLKTVFQIIPFDATVVGGEVLESTQLSLDQKKNTFGQVVFKEGDLLKLKVTNEGTRAIYFTLLDLSPDGTFSVVIPQRNLAPEDYRLEPGKTMETEFLIIGPPYGNEVFKLVSSEQPLDLRPIATNRGKTKGSRGDSNPFEKLFADTFKDIGVRSTTTLPSGSISVYTDTFIIEKAE